MRVSPKTEEPFMTEQRAEEILAAAAVGAGGFSSSELAHAQLLISRRNGPPFFDVERFRQLVKMWKGAGHDGGALNEAFAAIAEFNKPFVEYFQKLVEAETIPHKKMALDFWLSCLGAGLYPHRAVMGPTSPGGEFDDWAQHTCPFFDEATQSVPNLEKLNE